MPVTDAFRAFTTELFDGLGPIGTKRMFGGLGLYLDDAMFGLVVDDVIYLKTDDALAEQFRAAGSSCFSYETRTGTKSLTSYYELPQGALDSPDDALEWAQKSLIPARTAATRRTQKKAKRS